MPVQNSSECLMDLPSNSRRREENLAAAVEFCLQRSAYLELRRVECRVQEGILTLAGNVSSHYLRQVAQASVQRLQGVQAIDNQLTVGSWETDNDRWGGD
jgi:osmotically-inducible protein OsmY